MNELGAHVPLVLALLALPGRSLRRRPAAVSGRDGTSRSGTAAELARTLIAETREEIARADQKAGTLLAAAGLAAGVVGASIMAGQWSPFGLRPAAAVLWWLAVAGTAAGIALLGAVIYPRSAPGANGRAFHYYGHGEAHDGPDGVAAALRDRATVPELERLAGALYPLARIVTRKYRLTRWAIWTFAGVGLLLAACIVASRPGLLP